MATAFYGISSVIFAPIANALNSSFGMMVISTASSLAINIAGVGAGTASLMVSVLCLFNTAGRLIAGSNSDKLGRINTLTVAIIIALAGLTAMYIADVNASLVSLVIGLILVGICFGTFMGVFPGFCTDQFGSRHNTVNYGIMWIGFSLAGLVGPSILTRVYAATGVYRMAFVIAACIAVLGLVLTFVFRALNKRLA